MGLPYYNLRFYVPYFVLGKSIFVAYYNTILISLEFINKSLIYLHLVIFFVHRLGDFQKNYRNLDQTNFSDRLVRHRALKRFIIECI